MKTQSLKLDGPLFEATEQLRKEFKKPRFRYINEALEYCNRIQREKITKSLLAKESKIVREESMKVLSEFEKYRII